MEDFKNFDIIFVSAFGRHHWLAMELAKSEWQVAHVDVSKLLGQYEDQDLRSPFGLSTVRGLNPEQLQNWHRQAKSQKIESGTSLLLENGPIEAGGPLKNFYRPKLEGDAKAIRPNFDQDWIQALGKQMASSVYLPNARASSLETSVPIFEDVYKDLSTFDTRSSEQFFEDFKSVRNVLPMRLSSFEKLPDGFYKLGLEVSSEKRGAVDSLQLKTRVVVWALTSAETEHLSHELSKTIFAGKILEPSWAWQRYHFKGPSEVIDLWPIQFYILDHLRLPWTHENLALVSKRFSASFDVWLRVPIIFRFNSDYHFDLAERFKKNLRERFCSEEFELNELPLESKMAKEKLGPPRYPVYPADQIKSFKIPLRSERLIFESCEFLHNHQAQVRLVFQNELLEKLTSMRKQWLAIEAKQNQKAINLELSQRE